MNNPNKIGYNKWIISKKIIKELHLSEFYEIIKSFKNIPSYVKKIEI